MSFSRPGNYPYPHDLKQPGKIEEYLNSLYRSLIERDSVGEYMKDKSTDADLKALIVRPEWYGAKGDGVTDDAAAIQAAINAANIAGGGTVQFSRGPYGIASGLTLYGNIRYHGHGHGIASGGYFTKGTTISWLGGTSGTMVTANDTWGVMWDGISLKGNLSTVPSSTVVGISVNSTNPSNNSQRNYFRNFSIYGCDYAMGFDKDYPTATNTDGWVVENFLIYDCNVGVYTDSQNVAYATIRNGAIGVHDVGIYLNRSGFLKIESIAFGGHDPKGAIGAMIYAPQSYVVGVLLIEQCQSEGGTGFNFMDFRGGTINRGYPMTLLSNNIDQPVVMNNGQDCLVSIGNIYHENMTINGNDSHVYSLADVFSGIGIVDAGISNSIMTINSSGGIGTPSLDIPHDIECGGDINVPTGKAYTINGATVVNQDVSNMSDPRFESINVLGTEETLIDGAFENWVSATDLTSWVEVTTGTTTINKESSVIHGGTFACRFDVDSSNSDAYLFQDVTWLANYPYTLSIWHKTPSVNAAWVVIQDLVNDVFLQPDWTWGATFAGLNFPASPSGYSKRSFGFNSNSGTSYRITIQRGIATSLSLYFDDFSISKMLVFGGVNTCVDQPVKTTSTPSFAAVKVGANQVVGAQAAAVADATDAASVILRLNELLARQRAHGLIAT